VSQRTGSGVGGGVFVILIAGRGGLLEGSLTCRCGLAGEWLLLPMERCFGSLVVVAAG
jgi:hypothetical protein